MFVLRAGEVTTDDIVDALNLPRARAISETETAVELGVLTRTDDQADHRFTASPIIDASNTHQEYLETAGELLRTPARMIQLAIQEHDRRVDEPTGRVLDEEQQTLSDALEDIIDIPGIDVDIEAALSDRAAQRLHDQVQRELGESR
ncbi:MAG: hypothetical protein V5A62_04835 [Haloarculaceae archaeon]